MELADVAAAPAHRAARREEPVLTARADGRLDLRLGARHCVVSVRPCFPWSAPARLVSLRDDDEGEVCLVADPSRLDAVSRRALDTALAAAGFVFAVARVLAIEEEVEVRVWRVETAQGPRTFQTRMDDWPRELPDGGLLVRDVAGDLYRLPAARGLDAASRELLWAFTDT